MVVSKVVAAGGLLAAAVKAFSPGRLSRPNLGFGVSVSNGGGSLLSRRGRSWTPDGDEVTFTVLRDSEPTKESVSLTDEETLADAELELEGNIHDKYDMEAKKDAGFDAFMEGLVKSSEYGLPPEGLEFLDQADREAYMEGLGVVQSKTAEWNKQVSPDGGPKSITDSSGEEVEEVLDDEQAEHGVIPVPAWTQPGCIISFFNETAPYVISRWQIMRPLNVKDGAMLVRRVSDEEFNKIGKEQPRVFVKMAKSVDEINNLRKKGASQADLENQMAEMDKMTDEAIAATARPFREASFFSEFPELAILRVDRLFNQNTQRFIWGSETKRTHWLLTEGLPNLMEADKQLHHKLKLEAAKRKADPNYQIKPKSLQEDDEDDQDPHDIPYTNFAFQRASSKLFLQEPFWEQPGPVGLERLETFHGFFPTMGVSKKDLGLAGYLTKYPNPAIPLNHMKIFSEIETMYFDNGFRPYRFQLLLRVLMIWYKIVLQQAWISEQGMMDPYLDAASSYRVELKGLNSEFNLTDPRIRETIERGDLERIGEILTLGQSRVYQKEKEPPTAEEIKMFRKYLERQGSPEAAQLTDEQIKDQLVELDMNVQLNDAVIESPLRPRFTSMDLETNRNPEDAMGPVDSIDVTLSDISSLDIYGENNTWVYDIVPSTVSEPADPNWMLTRYPALMGPNSGPEWAAMHMLDSMVGNGAAKSPWLKMTKEDGSLRFKKQDDLLRCLDEKWEGVLQDMRVPVYEGVGDIVTLKRMKRKYKTGQIVRSYKVTLTPHYLTWMMGSLGCHLLGGLQARDAATHVAREMFGLGPEEEIGDAQFADMLLDRRVFRQIRKKMLPKKERLLKDDTIYNEITKVLEVALNFAPAQRPPDPLALAGQISNILFVVQGKMMQLMTAIQSMVPEDAMPEDLDEETVKKINILQYDVEDARLQAQWAASRDPTGNTQAPDMSQMKELLTNLDEAGMKEMRDFCGLEERQIRRMAEWNWDKMEAVVQSVADEERPKPENLEAAQMTEEDFHIFELFYQGMAGMQSPEETRRQNAENDKLMEADRQKLLREISAEHGWVSDEDMLRQIKEESKAVLPPEDTQENQ
mmetsp:Transcript_16062/g.32541  ORF Transcript_16062/g.32541 Transcript_16062/m.32541 type:complete len:1090 (-) Transcript_16062:51-3320(-)